MRRIDHVFHSDRDGPRGSGGGAAATGRVRLLCAFLHEPLRARLEGSQLL